MVKKTIQQKLTKNQLASTYKEFSRQKYNKYHHQFPRMRQSEIVGKIIKQWEALHEHQKRELHNKYSTQEKLQSSQSKSQSQDQIDRNLRDKPNSQPPVFQSSNTEIKKGPIQPFRKQSEQEQDAGSDYTRSDHHKCFDVSVSQSDGQLGQRPRRPRKNQIRMFERLRLKKDLVQRLCAGLPVKKKRRDTYDKFFRYFHQQLKLSHPTWTTGQRISYIKLLWKKRQIFVVLEQPNQDPQQHQTVIRKYKHTGIGIKYLRNRFRHSGICDQCGGKFCFLDKHVYRVHPYYYENYIDAKYCPLPKRQDFKGQDQKQNEIDYMQALDVAKRIRPVQLHQRILRPDQLLKPLKNVQIDHLTTDTIQQRNIHLPVSNQSRKLRRKSLVGINKITLNANKKKQQLIKAREKARSEKLKEKTIESSAQVVKKVKVQKVLSKNNKSFVIIKQQVQVPVQKQGKLPTKRPSKYNKRYDKVASRTGLRSKPNNQLCQKQSAIQIQQPELYIPRSTSKRQRTLSLQYTARKRKLQPYERKPECILSSLELQNLDIQRRKRQRQANQEQKPIGMINN